MLARFTKTSLARLAPALAFITGGVAIVLAFAAFAGASPYNWTPDSTWQTNGRVRTIVYSGGVAYLGGEFTQVRPPGPSGTPVTRNHLAAFDEATGQLLPWDPNADGIVWSLDVSGSTVYVGGEFLNVGGQARPHAAAISTVDGTPTSWNPQPNGTVNVVQVGPNGNVYMGGSFTLIGTANRKLIGSVTPAGAVTTWHPLVKQVTGSTCPPRCAPFVTSFAFAPDGQSLYFGGHFGLVNTIGRNNAARVDLTTGTTTMAWNPDVFGQGLGKNPNQANKVWSIALGPNRAYICGDWWSVDGFQRHPNIAGADLVDGHLDKSFDITTDGNTQSCVLSGGILFLGGHYDNIGPNSAWVVKQQGKSTLTGPGSRPTVHIAAVNADTGAIDPWNPGINSTLGVHYMTKDATHFAVGGDFTRFGGVDQQGFVQLSFDTTPPDTIIDSGPSGTVTVPTATFTFHSTEKGSSFQCSLDGGAFSPCTSPTTYTGLADGNHNFQVAAIDTAGNLDPTPASRAWTINTQPPDPPTGLSASATSPSRVDLSWVASPQPDVGRYDVYRGGVLLGSVSAPGTTYADRTVFGPTLFSYTVRAVDLAGNVSGDSSPATVTSLPSPPPFFGDGFETGDTSQWTASSGLTVQGSDVYLGSFAARATSTGSATYARENVTSASELFYEAHFKPVSLGTMANLIRFQTATGVQLLSVTMATTRKLGYRNDKTAVNVSSSTLVSLGTWHDLQARVFVNGAASEVEIWLDGARVGSLARTESLGTSPIGRVVLGNDLTGKTYDVLYDEAGVGASYVVPGTPAAPFAVTATAGVNSANVSWKPPYDGGSAITSYTVTSSPGGLTATVGGSTLNATVTGLTNGTTYTFTVTATNALGTGPASGPSNPVTPATTAPGPPTGVTATAGVASATVSWSPPGSDGGSPITGYTVTASPGGATASVDGNTLSTVVTGLTNGTTYTFTVTATNAIGTGPPSAPSNPVTPATTPDAPTGVTATGGISSAQVSWSAPAFDGGSPITSYTVTSSPGGITATVGGGTLTATVTGLTNGTTYTFTVTAANVVGPGPASAPSNPVTPQATVPGKPTNVAATPGPSSAKVSWQAPASDGGSPITSYTVTSSPGGVTATVNGSTFSTTVNGLTNGTTYTFTVTATNGVGTGPASDPSNPVTPSVTAPGAPQNVTAAPHDSSATINWQAPPSDGGSPITSYTVTSSPGGITATVDGSTFTTTMIGLTNGTTYTFTVTATNAIGTGPASAPSNPVTPALLPGPPTGQAAIEGVDSAIVSWSPPASDGGSPIISYTVTSSPGGITATVNGSTLSANVTGLTGGTAYTFTVTAANGTGSGPASAATSPVTPYDAMSRSISIGDAGISPTSLFARGGDTVTWNFTGPSNNHSVTDATGLGLYNTGLLPPGSVFSYSYFAAGVYAYVDLGTPNVSGEVRIPLQVSPTSGTSTTVFAIRWAQASPPAGQSFDVQIMKPGASSFVSWKLGVTATNATFSSSDPAWIGPGTYSFRARLKNGGNGHTGWSGSKTITVS